MYLIGLTKEWVFEAPFATVPIETEPFRENEESQELDPKTFGSENLAFLSELLKKRDHATPTSP